MDKIRHHHRVVFGLAGFSGSGKTTLAVSIIEKLSNLNFTIASIKHAHHDFEVDKPGKDSWRHRQAGSSEVIISSKKRLVHLKEAGKSKEANLNEILSMIPRKDVVLVEGFKKESFPKLEVWRDLKNYKPLYNKDSNIFALATDNISNKKLSTPSKVPVLPLNNIEEVIAFILSYFNLNKNTSKVLNNNSEVSFENAKEIIFQNIISKSKSIKLPLKNCTDKVLSKNIMSKYDLPQKANAAVDGYGFSYKDYNTLQGSEFTISKVYKAGLSKKIKVPKNTSIRIFTGAVLPYPIDTIAMQEDCLITDGKVFIPPNIKKNINCRPAGENISKNELLIAAGKKLDATDIGLAASSGYPKLPINLPLEVAIISNGNELIKPEGTLKDGLIFDSNGPMLQSLVFKSGNNPNLLEISADDPVLLKELIEVSINESDAVIISGGASEGDEDHVHSVIKSMNGNIHFWRLAIKPGRPMGFASIKKTPIFCLPGNPVAAQLCFRLLVKFGLNKRNGANNADTICINAYAQFNQKCRLGRKEFLRGKLFSQNGKLFVDINGKPGAGVLTSLSGADGLIEIPENKDCINFGDLIKFLPFNEVSI